MGRRHQKARKRSRVLRTNYGESAGGGGDISERESTWDVRTKSETCFRSETEQEVGQR